MGIKIFNILGEATASQHANGADIAGLVLSIVFVIVVMAAVGSSGGGSSTPQSTIKRQGDNGFKPIKKPRDQHINKATHSKSESRKNAPQQTRIHGQATKPKVDWITGKPKR